MTLFKCDIRELKQTDAAVKRGGQQANFYSEGLKGQVNSFGP